MASVKTLLLTRPEVQSRALAQEIGAAFPGRTRCLISPLMEIHPTGSLPDMSAFQVVLFTSVNGVKAYVDQGGPTDISCFCVGGKTASVARSLGLTASSANGDGGDLVTLVTQSFDTGAHVLHVHGHHTTGDVVGQLSVRGFKAEGLVLYHQQAQALNGEALDAFARGEVAGLPLYSPRTAKLLAQAFEDNPDWPTEDLTALCLSPNVAAEFGRGARKIAPTPDRDGMFALLREFLS